METKGPALKDKLLEFFRRKKVDLPAAKDICCEILGETSVKKAVPVPLWASTITRQMDGIEEDIEAQLLGLKSHRGTQSNLTSPLMLTRRQQCLVLCDIFFRRMCMRICYVHFVANQPHSFRTIQVLDWLHIRKTALVTFTLCLHVHGWRSFHDWMALWFHCLDQTGCFWTWVYILFHP